MFGWLDWLFGKKEPEGPRVELPPPRPRPPEIGLPPAPPPRPGPSRRERSPVGALLEDLRHRDHKRRLLAVEELGRLGPAAREGLEGLILARIDPDPTVRQAAQAALARVDPGWASASAAQRAIAALIKALANADDNVVRSAAELLTKIGPPA